MDREAGNVRGADAAATTFTSTSNTMTSATNSATPQDLPSEQDQNCSDEKARDLEDTAEHGAPATSSQTVVTATAESRAGQSTAAGAPSSDHILDDRTAAENHPCNTEEDGATSSSAGLGSTPSPLGYMNGILDDIRRGGPAARQQWIERCIAEERARRQSQRSVAQGTSVDDPAESSRSRMTPSTQAEDREEGSDDEERRVNRNVLFGSSGHEYLSGRPRHHRSPCTTHDDDDDEEMEDDFEDADDDDDAEDADNEMEDDFEEGDDDDSEYPRDHQMNPSTQAEDQDERIADPIRYSDVVAYLVRSGRPRLLPSPSAQDADDKDEDEEMDDDLEDGEDDGGENERDQSSSSSEDTELQDASYDPGSDSEGDDDDIEGASNGMPSYVQDADMEDASHDRSQDFDDIDDPGAANSDIMDDNGASSISERGSTGSP